MGSPRRQGPSWGLPGPDDVLVLWTFHTANESLDLPATATSAPAPLATAPSTPSSRRSRPLPHPARGPGLVWLNPAPARRRQGRRHSGQRSSGGLRLPDIRQLKTCTPACFRAGSEHRGLQTTPYPSSSLPPRSARALPCRRVSARHRTDKTDAFALANSLAARVSRCWPSTRPYTATGHQEMGTAILPSAPALTANLFADRLHLYRSRGSLETFDLVTARDRSGRSGGADLASPRSSPTRWAPSSDPFF